MTRTRHEQSKSPLILLGSCRLSDLKSQKVAFLVCNNTLVGRKIDPDSLFEVFKDDIVPSGNAEIAHLQGLGFAYIRP